MISEANYCCESETSIENYEKAISDNTQMWHCHHRLETHYENGKRRTEKDLLAQDLIKMGLYYNRPAKELIYLTPKEHAKLHRKTMEERKTIETFEKMSEKAKNRHVKHTAEWNENIAKAHRGVKLSEVHKLALRKNHVGTLGKKMPGFHWYNDGNSNLRIKSEICPEGFLPGKCKKKPTNNADLNKELSF